MTIVLVALGVIGASPTAAVAADPSYPTQGAYKAANDTDPHLALSASAKRGLADKERLARAHYEHLIANYTPGAYSPCCPDNLLGGNQQPQNNSYYCGPAAVSETLSMRSVALSQDAAAGQLKTNSSGTAWSGVNANIPSSWNTGYPVPDVINYNFNSRWYYPIGVPSTPSSSDLNTYKSNLTYDIDSVYSVVGDAWEVAGYAHLTGHPQNQTIFHWFMIRGYRNYGGGTDYEDSATSVWSSVPAYTYNFDSGILLGILGGRGYDW
jgi:hypothetical protein